MPFIEFAGVLLRHTRMLIAVPLACSALVVLVNYLRPRTYTATTSFTPQSSESGASRLSGLAAQFGLDVGSTGDASQSTQFYEHLVESREILGPAVAARYSVVDRADSGATLVELLGVEGGSEAVRRSAAIRELRDALTVAVNRESGIVTLSVRTEWPTISAQIAERILSLVNAFNLGRRQSRAAAERAFIEGRLADARDQLRRAENQLQGFLQRNRQYQSDPQLVFERDRLQREMTMQQQIYTSLSQGFEQASLDALRNTPVITVVEKPEIPATPDARGLATKAILGLVFGFVIALVLALARDFVRRSRHLAPDQFEDFDRLRDQALAQLRRPWGRGSGAREAGAE